MALNKSEMFGQAVGLGIKGFQRKTFISVYKKHLIFVSLPIFIIYFFIAWKVFKPETTPKNEPQTQQAQKLESKPTQQANLAPKVSQTPIQNSNTAEVKVQPESVKESKAKPEPVNLEQKFGKRIYLATKDDYVNLRKAPSGEILTPIYKKDFEAIRIYSFDTNAKWLKVSYFPAGATDESQMISGYIHISQIDKSKF